MRRMRVSSYLQAAFVKGDAPAPSTIIKGIRNRSMPGEQVGGKYFVYVNDDLSLAMDCIDTGATIKPVNNSAATIFKAAGIHA
jgi:hypothetical protein